MNPTGSVEFAPPPEILPIDEIGYRGFHAAPATSAVHKAWNGVTWGPYDDAEDAGGEVT